MKSIDKYVRKDKSPNGHAIALGAGYSKLLMAALAKGFQIYHDGCARSIRRPTYLSTYALFWNTRRSELYCLQVRQPQIVLSILPLVLLNSGSVLTEAVDELRNQLSPRPIIHPLPYGWEEIRIRIVLQKSTRK